MLSSLFTREKKLQVILLLSSKSPNQERLSQPKKHSETKAKYNQEFNSMIKLVNMLFRKRALDDWYPQARSRLSAGLRKGWREINKFSSPIGSNKVALG